MFNTQKSEDQANTQKYRNSTLIKIKKTALVLDLNWPILRIFGIGSDLKKLYRCIPNWLYTRKHKGVVFRFIHSGTRFKQIVFSGSQNARSVWTKCQYDTKYLRIQLNESPCVRGLTVTVFCMSV